MNQRNVEALQEIVREASERQIIQATFLDYRQFAAWLADKGVLMPSALTSDDMWRIGETIELQASVECLERIAKGTSGGEPAA